MIPTVPPSVKWKWEIITPSQTGVSLQITNQTKSHGEWDIYGLTCSLQRNLWMASLPTVWILLRSNVILQSGLPSCPVASSRLTRPSPASRRTRRMTKRACMCAWDTYTQTHGERVYMFWHSISTQTETYSNTSWDIKEDSSMSQSDDLTFLVNTLQTTPWITDVFIQFKTTHFCHFIQTGSTEVVCDH